MSWGNQTLIPCKNIELWQKNPVLRQKSLWRKVWITDSQQISDFFVLKITQKICGAARTRIILFTLIMDRFKRRKIDFWLWRWHDNEERHGSSLIIDLLFFRIKILFWTMPFVNHDSDKTKYRDRIFSRKFQRKNRSRMAFSKKSDLTIGPEFFI
jgi:hypothetical protein